MAADSTQMGTTVMTLMWSSLLVLLLSVEGAGHVTPGRMCHTTLCELFFLLNLCSHPSGCPAHTAQTLDSVLQASMREEAGDEPLPAQGICPNSSLLSVKITTQCQLQVLEYSIIPNWGLFCPECPTGAAQARVKRSKR